MNPVTYTSRGSVRGGCGHKHKTIAGAVECQTRDAVQCARLPGGKSYSDRHVERTDGTPLTDAECDAIWKACEQTRDIGIIREWGDLPGPRAAKPRKRPATGLTASYPLRHSPEQRKAWQRKADAAGMDLAAWIRARLDAG